MGGELFEFIHKKMFFNEIKVCQFGVFKLSSTIFCRCKLFNCSYHLASWSHHVEVSSCGRWKNCGELGEKLKRQLQHGSRKQRCFLNSAKSFGLALQDGGCRMCRHLCSRLLSSQN